MENAILVVGSVALDSVSTPSGEGRENLGGSAVYFSLAASLFSPIRVVAVVGQDFPDHHHALLRGRADVSGLKVLPGKTFRWSGRYGEDLSSAQTLETQLNVFAQFRPALEEHHRRTPYLFLANIDPELQFEVLAQVDRPRVIACDTMNYWIDSKRSALKELLGRVDIFFVNEAEARSLSGNSNTLAAARTLSSWGPSVVVVKKGENGCLLFAHGKAYPVPAFPVPTVQDPTGAGDSFAGGFLGYLAARGADLRDAAALRGAAMVGSVIASFGIEAFGTRRFETLSLSEVKARCDDFSRLVQADPVFENCLVFPRAVITLDAVTKRFDDLVAVNNVSLDVSAGEIFGFLGPNGAGKTTTVKMLTGLMKPTSGRVRVAGFDMAEKPLDAKRLMGLVPDEPFVYPKLTGIEFLQFVGDLYGVPHATQQRRIPELLEMFELKDWGSELLESYSHGMRQKTAIAALLLHEPKVIVLDEPLVGLDPKSARLVKDILVRLAQRGAAIFMCTHVLEIAEKLCRRAGIMIQGKIIALGTLEELRRQAARENHSLEDVFLSLTGGTEYASLLKNL